MEIVRVAREQYRNYFDEDIKNGNGVWMALL